MFIYRNWKHSLDKEESDKGYDGTITKTLIHNTILFYFYLADLSLHMQVCDFLCTLMLYPYILCNAIEFL